MRFGLVAWMILSGFLAFSGPAMAQRQAVAETPIRIQLKWFHQFQFAGYYAALEKGFFEEAGLDVRLIAGGPTIDPAHAVMFGEAEFGVGNSTLLLDRADGMPLVAVSAIFQHSPFVILARRDAGLETVKDLEGRTMMAEAHAAELFAYLKLAGVDLSKIQFVDHTGDISNLAAEDPSGIDATTAYSTTEPYDAIRLDLPYRIFNPRERTIDFYGDTLFTTEAFLERNPATVKALRDALLKGWAYALSHQEEIISIIMEKYAPKIDRLHMSYEAQTIYDLLATELVEIGYMSETRWRQIADVFVEAGMLDAGFSLEGFVYVDEEPVDPKYYYWIATLALIAIIGFSLAHRFWRLNRRLREEIFAKEALRVELEALATTDALSGLANRRELSRWAHHEISRAKRQQDDLALIQFDLDGFKGINDRWGHALGDRAISLVADAMRRSLREIDLAARVGGDEFVAVLPKADLAAANRVLTRLRGELHTAGLVSDDGSPVAISASFGVAVLQFDDRTLEDLMHRADTAMYKEKEAHREVARMSDIQLGVA